MDLSLVLMLLAAALFHSTWHALIKVSDDRLIGLAGMNVVSAGLSLLALPVVQVPDPAVWKVLFFSVALHNAYKIGLAQVYRHGELGQAYPIARGFCPIFATLIAFFALGEIPNIWQALGVILISGGILFIGLDQQRSKSTLALLIAAAVTGFLVASYTVVDAHGTRLNQNWLSYVVWLMLLDGSAFIGVVALLRGRVLWRTIARSWHLTLISGLLGIAAFSVLLWALSRGPIGGVSALRETSVLFASLIGFVFLKEQWSMSKIVGAVFITIGIVVFAI